MIFHVPKSSCTVILLLAAVSGLYNVNAAASPDSLLTGNLHVDLMYVSGFAGDARPAFAADRAASKRDIPLAAALSAVLPGAGQAYNRSWIKMTLLAGVEASLITGYFVWRRKGHQEEDVFKAFAHANWSPIRYAMWLNRYTGNGGARIAIPDLTEEMFMQPDSWSPRQQAEVRAFFNAIRAAEDQSYHIETGAAFSHVLPFFGEQQYYELIGKYFQFAPGWEDYNGANDPEETGPNGEKVNVPPDSQFYEYDDMHENANNLLRRASRVSALIIVNHFLAAIDAAVTAKLRVDRLDSAIALSRTPDGRYAPMVYVSYSY